MAAPEWTLHTPTRGRCWIVERIGGKHLADPRSDIGEQPLCTLGHDAPAASNRLARSEHNRDGRGCDAPGLCGVCRSTVVLHREDVIDEWQVRRGRRALPGIGGITTKDWAPFQVAEGVRGPIRIRANQPPKFIAEPLPLPACRGPDARRNRADGLRSDLVQFDVSRHAEERGAVQHGRREEASLPEMARHAVLPVPRPRARLLEQAVEEAEIGQFSARASE